MRTLIFTPRPRHCLRNYKNSLLQAHTPSSAVIPHSFRLCIRKPSHVMLHKLPCLNARHEDNHANNRYSQLPADPFMLEHRRVQSRNINGGQDAERTEDNRPEQELILIDIFEEKEPARCVVWIECKHTPAQTLEFPSRDKDHPSQFHEYGCTCAEDNIT